MWNIMKAESEKELLSSACWKRLKEEDREKLLSLYGQGLLRNQEPLASSEKSFAIIVSKDNRALFLLSFTAESEESAYLGVCLPEDFSPEEDLPEEVSDELFDHLDQMERENGIFLLIEANSEEEAEFWEDVGLTELEGYCWMRSGSDRHTEELSHPKENSEEKPNVYCKEEPQAEKTENKDVSIAFQKLSPEDPVFQETLSIIFEEPKEVFRGQLSDLSETQRENCEALLVHADGKIVGQAFFLPYENGYQLTYFGIFPKYRRQGYGTRTFSKILAEYSPLYLSVKTDSPARLIYERAGMEICRYLSLFSLGE